jgi:hypothetical protein
MPLNLKNRVQQTGTANTTVSFTLTGTVTGFQTFATAAIANGDTTYYTATDASGNWEVGLGTYLTAGPTLQRTTIFDSSLSGFAVTFSGIVNVFITLPASKVFPAGSTGEVQYNDAGDVAGATNVTINDNDLTLVENATPVVPPFNKVKLFAENLAGKILPAYFSPSGVPAAIQPLLGQNKLNYWSAAMGSTTLTGASLTLTATGTATAPTWATTNLLRSTARLDFRVTTAATTATAGYRGNASCFWRGNAAGRGGFLYVWRGGIGGALTPTLTSARFFVGLRAITTAPTDVAPSTLTNSIGLGFDSTDTTWQVYSAGTAFDKGNTGITLQRAVESQLMELIMYCPPNGSEIKFLVNELGTANSYSRTVITGSNTIPSNITALNNYGYMSAGGISTTVAIAVNSIYIETDY